MSVLRCVFSSRVILASICLLTVAIVSLPTTGRVFAVGQASQLSHQLSTANTSSLSPKTFVSFSAFLKNVSNARYHDYVSQSSGRAVRNEQAFAEMRSYILDMYAGVKQVNSFILDGRYFDCITVDSQPTVNHLHIKQIAKPPQVTTMTTPGKDDTHGLMKASNSPLTLGQKDEFGNPIACQDGTIPMERITLEETVRFPTLHDFLTKEYPKRDVSGHFHALGFRYIDNYGGGSWLNVWNPNGISTGSNEWFSLSQQWYSGGSGDSLQTVEGGWIRPQEYLWKKDRSVLFIHYTPDNYNHGFVQTNKNWALGGGFTNYSTLGGSQYAFMMRWQFAEGNWWLFLQGAGNSEAVGYYDGSIYHGGQLTRYAQQIAYGGETFLFPTGGSDWPQMGSGHFAAEGWQRAAYQNDIFYVPNGGGIHQRKSAELYYSTGTPSCYTINITPYTKGGSWGTYFYFGGPGRQCQT